MGHKIRISLVSYWNTKPFLYGLQHAPMREKLDLQLDIPSVGGRKILDGNVDIGLVPVAVLAKLDDARLITDYCIGANGKVMSVCLYSHVPIEEIKEIFLDDHSMTSVRLLRILLNEYWKIQPALLPAYTGYTDDIHGTTAGLVIGDRAIALNDHFPYVYDLAEAWKAYTGLPFVFAAWIARTPQFIDNMFELNEALKYGVHNIAKVVEEANTQIFTKESLYDYLTNYISYDLDADKRRALELLEKIKSSTYNSVL